MKRREKKKKLIVNSKERDGIWKYERDGKAKSNK